MSTGDAAPGPGGPRRDSSDHDLAPAAWAGSRLVLVGHHVRQLAHRANHAVADGCSA